VGEWYSTLARAVKSFNIIPKEKKGKIKKK
jgi:hypothetical protein